MCGKEARIQRCQSFVYIGCECGRRSTQELLWFDDEVRASIKKHLRRKWYAAMEAEAQADLMNNPPEFIQRLSMRERLLIAAWVQWQATDAITDWIRHNYGEPSVELRNVRVWLFPLRVSVQFVKDPGSIFEMTLSGLRRYSAAGLFSTVKAWVDRISVYPHI